VCIGRDAPFVRSTRSHKIQTGTGQELLRSSVELVLDKTPLASSTPGRRSRERVLPPQSTDLSNSLARNASGFQATFFGMLSAWSASFLEDMTHTSRATNLQNCDARQFWPSRKAIMQHAENVAASFLTTPSTSTCPTSRLYGNLPVA
jgi:hypothetical protein